MSYKWMLWMSVMPACAMAQDTPNMDFINPMLQGMPIDEISTTAIEGLHEMRVGSEIFYLSTDGRYLLRGELVDLMKGINLTEDSRSKVRLKALQEIDKNEVVVFPASHTTKHVVYVFTDIDCGYCRTLHSQIKNYNELGIEVRYLSFPRAGLYSESYQKAINVWCAEDRQKAMTEAKAGQNLPAATCSEGTNPVRKQYELGLRLGVTGTPAIVMEDGKLLPGYLPPKELLNTLEQLSSEQQQHASLR